jgi:hypothetical protein
LRAISAIAFTHLQAKADVLRHVHIGKQRIALKHHADAAFLRRLVGDFIAADADAARGRGFKAGNHAQHGGFAAAGRAEEGNELALFDAHIEVVHHDMVVKALVQIIDGEVSHVCSLDSVWAQAVLRAGRALRANTWISPIEAQVTRKAMMASADGS